MPSSHAVPSGSLLTRQPPLPLQVSGLSQSLFALLPQAVPDGWNPSAGHAALLPSHVSAASHAPAAGRHGVPDGTTPSAGQSTETPSQLSSASHTSAPARHSVP